MIGTIVSHTITIACRLSHFRENAHSKTNNLIKCNFPGVQSSSSSRKATNNNASGNSNVRGNVPVGADVKASVNFDCPEEFGYYPHPSDCTQYYVCVFGGALLESCTGGLMYRWALKLIQNTCNYN